MEETITQKFESNSFVHSNTSWINIVLCLLIFQKNNCFFEKWHQSRDLPEILLEFFNVSFIPWAMSYTNPRVTLLQEFIILGLKNQMALEFLNNSAVVSISDKILTERNEKYQKQQYQLFHFSRRIFVWKTGGWQQNSSRTPEFWSQNFGSIT